MHETKQKEITEINIDLYFTSKISLTFSYRSVKVSDKDCISFHFRILLYTTYEMSLFRVPKVLYKASITSVFMVVLHICNMAAFFSSARCPCQVSITKNA